jgi:hypothetical protein
MDKRTKKQTRVLLIPTTGLVLDPNSLSLLLRRLSSWPERMGRRRFLNLVVREYGSRIYSLCRLDPSKHLFYPSAAAAQEATKSAPLSDAKSNAKKTQKNRGSGGVSTMASTTAAGTTFCNRPPRTEINFQESPTLGIAFAWVTASRGRYSSDPAAYHMFASLLGDGGGGGESGSADDVVLFADASGHTAVYDAGTKSVVTMPSSSIRVAMETATLSTTTSEGESCLYVMDLAPNPWANHDPCRFEALVYRRDDLSHPPVKPYYAMMGWRWYRRALQSPPFLADPEYRRTRNKMPAYAVVDGGATICVSSGAEALGTYAFDTAEQEWRHAGKWLLPFAGRAELVPELGLWFGLSASSPHGSLCALDLSNATSTDMEDSERPSSALRHSWDVELGLPEGCNGWPPFAEHLVNLGAGRFCVARCFEPVKRKKTDAEITVLTGVEVSRCEDDGEDALRMTKHRSMVYRLQNHSIKHVF